MKRDYEKNYDNFVKAINLEEPLWVPTWDVLNNQEMWRKFGGGDDPLTVAAKTYAAVGIDATRFYWWYSNFDWFGSKIIDFSRFLGLDPAKWELKTKAGTTWISKRPFTNLEELESNLPQRPDEDKVTEWFISFYQKTIEKFKEYGVVVVGGVEGPLTEAYTYAGIDLFSKAIYMAPNVVKCLLSVFEEWVKIRVDLWAENNLGPAFFIGEDIALTNTLMFPPRWLKKHVFPRIKKVAQPLKGSGVKFIFHSDGNLDLILDYLVNELKIDALNPIEPAAGMDIGKVKEDYGNKIALIGNIDCSRLLSKGSPLEIEAVVKETIEVAAPGGGLCLGSSSEIHNAIPVENALTMYKAAKKYGVYPLKGVTRK